MEISEALHTMLDFSAPGPSSMGYCLLKWVHTAQPDALTFIFNLSIDLGIHLWKQAMVVVLNKPNHPDYSQPKVYHPISLLECMGKLLEKIIVKQVNIDIETNFLIPMMQFGLRPHHNTMDAIATLIHHI